MSKEKQTTDKTDERQERIDLIKTALVQGARSLHMNPIELGGGKQTTRLPLVTWVSSKTADGTKGKFFIIAILSKVYGATMQDIARALLQIKQERLAYIDTLSVRCEDIKDMVELLEDAMFTRGRTGMQAVALGHEGKVYVRDLNQAAMSKGGKKGLAIVVPEFMFKLLPTDKEELEVLSVVAGGDESAE